MTSEQEIARLKAEIVKLRAQISTDELTGLLNRRGIFERLEPTVKEINYQLANPERRRSVKITSLVVVLADIDNFKKINDQFGHSGGDQVLKKMGRELKGRVRSLDVLGRIGGEEFLVGFIGAELAIALKLADELRQVIANAAFKLESGQTVPVTASFGVAQLQAGESLQQAIDRADQALYRAKDKGRNRVEAAST